MTEHPAITATAAVTATAIVPLPPGWAAQPVVAQPVVAQPVVARPDRPLYAATGPGARLTLSFRELTDPRTLIPQQVRAAAGADDAQPAVSTSYLDLPAGRAILAQTAALRGAAQLWLPLPGGPGALVFSLVADHAAWTPDAAALLAEIGRRLLIERTASVRLRGQHSGSTVRSTAGRPVLAAR